MVDYELKFSCNYADIDFELIKSNLMCYIFRTKFENNESIILAEARVTSLSCSYYVDEYTLQFYKPEIWETRSELC